MIILYYNMEVETKIKIILVGDTNVGKTSLLNRKKHNFFNPVFSTTIGVDFMSYKLETNETVYVWDTAGQEKFKSIISLYFRNIDGVILVYDITNRKSFENISRWINKIKTHTNNNPSLIIVGNKCDLNKYREVSEEELNNISIENNCLGIESSSKENYNIDMIFNNIVKISKKTPQFEIKEPDTKKYNCCSIL